jgi:hypothetical protein
LYVEVEFSDIFGNGTLVAYFNPLSWHPGKVIKKELKVSSKACRDQNPDSDHALDESKRGMLRQ